MTTVSLAVDHSHLHHLSDALVCSRPRSHVPKPPGGLVHIAGLLIAVSPVHSHAHQGEFAPLDLELFSAHPAPRA